MGVTPGHNGGSPSSEQDAPRVVLVDDHDLFRTGLVNLLQEQGVHVVGEASDGHDALRQVRDLSPDVVIMDLNMPRISGVQATREILQAAPQTRVVVLTISTDDGDVVDAIMAGASGYLLKSSTVPQLVDGIRAAAAGDSQLSPEITTKVIDLVRTQSPVTTTTEPARPDLSDREVEVLKLIANGKDNQEIADALFISPKTVKNHISNILMKLGVNNRIQAAVYAVRSGIV